MRDGHSNELWRYSGYLKTFACIGGIEITAHTHRGVWTWALALVAVGFVSLTIREGGAVLLGNEAALAAAGSYVPLVLWFNFAAGFAYVIAGAGLWMGYRWAVWVAIAIAPQRRLRTLAWVSIATIAWRRMATGALDANTQ